MGKMKIMHIAILILSSLCEICATDRALVSVGNNVQLSMYRDNCAVGTMSVRLAVKNTEIKRVPSYQYTDSFEFSGENRENVVINFEKGYQVGSMFRRENLIEKTYPCKKIFLGFEPASGNSSYAVYSLSANTDEVGNLLLNDHYVDRSVAFPHLTKFVEDHFDDEHWCVIGTLITFIIDKDNIERQISSIPDYRQPCKVIMRQNNKCEINPGLEANVRVYIRPDGVEQHRNWEGIILIPKPIGLVDMDVARLMFVVIERFDLLNILQWEYRLNSGLPYFADIHLKN